MGTTQDAVDTIAWPPHKGGLHISHNQHHGYYETVEQALSAPPGHFSTYSRDDFPDEAEIAKAIATDSVWMIQWYPDTPVGFCRSCASTLSRALLEALA